MNAIGYVRVSTKEQAQDGLSLAMQSAEIDRAAWHNRDDLVVVFWDVQSAKTNGKRPGLQQALARLRSEQGTRLYVWRSDRLSRAGRKDLEQIDELRAEKISVISCQEGSLTETDADGEFMQFLRAGLNQRERRLIGERTKAALKLKSQNGERVGHPPFGWRVVYGPEVNAKRKLVAHYVPDREQQQTIERILKLNGQGISGRAIARELDVHRATVYKVIRKGAE